MILLLSLNLLLDFPFHQTLKKVLGDALLIFYFLKFALLLIFYFCSDQGLLTPEVGYANNSNSRFEHSRSGL